VKLLTQARLRGVSDALTKFAFGTDSSDDLVTALGAVHPGAAALGAGFTAPDDYAIGQAVRTGLGAAGGASLGEQGGSAAGKLLAHLMHTDPELLAAIGGTAGKALGGATGAHGGQTWANHSTAEDMRKERLMGGA